jgi:hypothetical protein
MQGHAVLNRRKPPDQPLPRLVTNVWMARSAIYRTDSPPGAAGHGLSDRLERTVDERMPDCLPDPCPRPLEDEREEYPRCPFCVRSRGQRASVQLSEKARAQVLNGLPSRWAGNGRPFA